MGGSLGSAEVVGEEGALGEGGVTTAAAARGTNTEAVGRSDTAPVGDALSVASAMMTVGSSIGTSVATSDKAVAVGGL